MAHIFPSLIAAPVLSLQKILYTCDPYVSGYHIDVMDFQFVPNMTWGPDIVNSLAQATERPLQIHLMVDYPEKYLERFNLPNTATITIHSECTSSQGIPKVLDLIRHYGWTPSIALNPETPIEKLAQIGPIEHILLMSVHPGFSGQEFMPMVYQKLAELIHYTHKLGYQPIIAIDGGVNLRNAPRLIQEGAQQLIVGSAIFSAEDPIAVLKELSAACRN